MGDKKLVAELSLDKTILQTLLKKSSPARRNVKWVEYIMSHRFLAAQLSSARSSRCTGHKGCKTNHYEDMGISWASCNICLKPGSGAIHIVLYVRRKGSQINKGLPAISS